MGSASTIFTQWECEIVIYRADEDGAPTEDVEWLGGCDNKMTLDQGFAEERADRSGDRYARWQQLEEEHSLELDRLWLTRYDRSEASFQTPVMARNQRLVAVLLWRDEEARIWHKRTYFGVQIGTLNISSESEFMSLRVPMRASHMIPASGDLDDTPPDLAPSSLGGLLRYFDSLGAVDLFSYDYDSGLFAGIGSPDSRLTLPGADGTYQFRMLINGALALAVNNAGVLMARGYTFTNGTFSDVLPRVEFLTGFGRIAALGADGVLAAPGFVERDTQPGATLEVVFRNAAGDWLASLNQSGLSAPAISDELP